jgi:hypothetical protein
MTRLPPPERWVFTRDTKLESGEPHIDGQDLQGVPVRLCIKQEPPPVMHLFNEANGREGETINDSPARTRTMGALHNE